MALYPFRLPAPVALATPVAEFTVAGVSDLVWQPKWDGFRAQVTREGIWSRAGKPLGRYFPDVARYTAQQLPPGAVLDSEIISWDTAHQRLDFTALTRRFTAGNRLAALAERHPAQLVAFDLLAADGADLRSRPLTERRAHLEQLLFHAGGGTAITLCQQTDQLDQAKQWFTDYTAGGLEGLVLKRAGQPYPTRTSRVWWKLKARDSVDLVVTAITGDPARPHSLVLALPSEDGTLRTVGYTTALTKAASAELGRVLNPTGASRDRWLTALARTAQQTTRTYLVDPAVVEVLADNAIDNGVLRHPARYLRHRPDLTPGDLHRRPEP